MRASESRKRSASRRQRRIGVALVSMIAITGALLASPSATATWSVALTGTGSAVAGTLTTVSTLSIVDFRVANEDYQTTHVATVQNNLVAGSTFTGTSNATLTVNPMANTGLASMMSVSVWPVASAAGCTAASSPAAGAVSAPWTTGLTATAPVGPNTSAYFCIRGYPTNSTPLPASAATAAAQNRSNVAAQLGSASALSFTPTYSARLDRGNFSATAVSGPISAISAFRMFPFAQLTPGTIYVGVPVLEDGVTGLCFNIAGGGNTSPPGTDLIVYTCSALAVTPRNERFTHIPVPGTSSFQIRVDSTDSTYGFLEATADGTVVESQVGDASNLRQRWIGQLLANGSRQLVNAATGYCLFAPSTNGGAVTTQPCNNIRGEASDWNAARL
jgi:hypothetical protein